MSNARELLDVTNTRQSMYLMNSDEQKHASLGLGRKKKHVTLSCARWAQAKLPYLQCFSTLFLDVLLGSFYLGAKRLEEKRGNCWEDYSHRVQLRQKMLKTNQPLSCNLLALPWRWRRRGKNSGAFVSSIRGDFNMENESRVISRNENSNFKFIYSELWWEEVSYTNGYKICIWTK